MAFFQPVVTQRVVANVRVNGQHARTLLAIEHPQPLVTTPLRSRPLNAAILPGAKLKLARARKHLTELHEMLAAWDSGQPIQTRQGLNDDGIEALQIRVRELVPAASQAVIGDVVHNLRSALDHLFCELIVANNGVPRTSSGYPLTDERVALQAKDVGARAARFFSRLRTSPRWNEAVFVLHELDRLDKHRCVIATAGASVEVKSRIQFPMGLMMPNGSDLFVPEGAPHDYRFVVLRTEFTDVHRFHPGLDERVDHRAEVVFSDDMPGAREPLLPMLYLLTGITERIMVLAERRLF